MTDTTLIAQFVASLNANIFLREFAFSRNRFTPKNGSELELADHVVRVGALLFLFQLKERDNSAKGSVESWIRNKVLKKATRQMRQTVDLLRRKEPLEVPNERGHIFDLASSEVDEAFRLVLFKSGDTRTTTKYVRYHISRTVGMIHILDALDYFGICQYLITPAEIAEYFKWREQVARASGRTELPSESALVGQYLLDEGEADPSEHYAQALLALREESHTFDLSFLLEGLGDRIEYASAADLEKSYYPILTMLALLTRLELRHLKERLAAALSAVREDRFELPYRCVSPRLACGFLVLPVTADQASKRLGALQNLSLAAKHEQRTRKQVGIAITKRESDVMIDWLYAESEWIPNEALDRLLADKYPFRSLKTRALPRYTFDTDSLRSHGLLREDSDHP